MSPLPSVPVETPRERVEDDSLNIIQKGLCQWVHTGLTFSDNISELCAFAEKIKKGEIILASEINIAEEMMSERSEIKGLTPPRETDFHPPVKVGGGF